MKGNSKTLLYGALIVTFLVIFHRPLPENFTDSLVDRCVMYFMEAILRFSYVYPSKLCPDAYCQLRWTRFTLEKLLALIGPWTDSDRDMAIEDITLDAIPTRVYIPYNRSNDGAIIFIHGGGFVLGNVKMYETMTRELARYSSMITFSIDYRLAPEHVFPAGLDDCERAVLHIMQHSYKRYGINRNRIAVMGDSAGGGLVASLTFRLRKRENIPKLKAQVLLYPLLQIHDLKTPSYAYYYREMSGTAFVDPQLVAQYYFMYAGIDLGFNAKLTSLALNNRHLSPTDRQNLEEYFNANRLPQDFKIHLNNTLRNYEYDTAASRLLAPYLLNPEFVPIVQSNLTGLPPALVVTCEFDVLRDEGTLYAERLWQAGVSTQWKHFSTGFHAMLNFHNTIGTADRSLSYIANWTRNNV